MTQVVRQHTPAGSIVELICQQCRRPFDYEVKDVKRLGSYCDRPDCEPYDPDATDGPLETALLRARVEELQALLRAQQKRVAKIKFTLERVTKPADLAKLVAVLVDDSDSYFYVRELAECLSLAEHTSGSREALAEAVRDYATANGDRYERILKVAAEALALAANTKPSR
jgi:hypothetical protein